jgi:hypothetical protein
MARKTAVVAVALLELLVIGSVIALRAAHWHRAGWTGFTYQPEYELPETIPDLPMLGQSLKVLIIVPGSPSDRAGIEINDRILAVNGIASDDIGQLRRLSDELAVGSTVSYELERGEQRLQLEVEVESPLQSPFQAARARLMAVVRRDGRPAGLILVGRPQGRAEYQEEERRFLATVADQVALAVSRSMQQQSEGELEQARAIQRSLLPQTLPEVTGLHVAARWEPAREVSGDYYDIISLDDSRLLVCIGDVVGKGLPAALLMSTLQAAVKAVAATTDAPAGICEQVRNVVCHSLSGGTFVTFFCAVVDRRHLNLSSANAGHNPPILARRTGDIVRLEQGGLAIARLLTSGYTQEETSLEPGDRLLLFTDGATEAMNPEGEMFGDEHLQRLASELVT